MVNKEYKDPIEKQFHVFNICMIVVIVLPLLISFLFKS